MKSEIVLLAYSGGLDTSAIIPWLIHERGYQVVAYCADLGGGTLDPKVLRDRARVAGACDLILEDLQETFASQFLFPLVRAGAIYEEEYLLGTAIARPLIAERMVHFAHQLGAKILGHGATGKGNDQIRFEKSWAYLAPELHILAPWKEWNFCTPPTREDPLKESIDQTHPRNSMAT